MCVSVCIVGPGFDLMFIVGQKIRINAFFIMLIDAFQRRVLLKCNAIALKNLFETLSLCTSAPEQDSLTYRHIED